MSHFLKNYKISENICLRIWFYKIFIRVWLFVQHNVYYRQITYRNLLIAWAWCYRLNTTLPQKPTSGSADAQQTGIFSTFLDILPN